MTETTAESPRSLIERHRHWLIATPASDASLYMVAQAGPDYGMAMIDAARADHPTARAAVAVYSRAWSEANGLPGLRADGIVPRECVEVVSPATVGYVLERATSEDPMALLAVYANTITIQIYIDQWTSHAMRVSVTADHATWVASDQRVISTISGWGRGGEVDRHRKEISAAEDRCRRAREGATPDERGIIMADMHLRAVRRAAGEYALAGEWARGLT